MKISYSAPAKIILTGEHSAVYGKPILISALDIRLTVTVNDAKQTKSDKNIDVIAKNVKAYLKNNNEKFTDKPYSLHIQSDIPSRRNLGSSAALSVAASAALLHFFSGHQFPKEVINQVAYESEKHFHGKPSGGDNSASCFGGFIYYRKEFEFLKNISSLNAKIPKSIMDRLFIIDSGKSAETTGEMVAQVGELYNKEPKKVEAIMNEIEKVTKRFVISIVGEDVNMFADAVKENERLLDELGVVSQKTKDLLKSLEGVGVGKVTGGGGAKTGSGNLLFFAKDGKHAEDIFKSHNIPYLRFVQDFAGCTLL